MTGEQFALWCKTFVEQGLKERPRRPLVMGIINVTPDSFYDGDPEFSTQKALERARSHVAEGADLLDIGGESTRPGATALSKEEELARVLPVIKAIRAESDICISIDTYKPEVMTQAVLAGANLVNDISGLSSLEARVCLAQLNVPVCIMHMQGRPQNMQERPFYDQGVLLDVLTYFEQRIEECLQSGMKREQLILDVGIGFGKTVNDNLALIKEIARFKSFDLPLLLGVSRKNFIGQILSLPVNRRLFGSLAIASYAAMQGVAIIRTHDVGSTYETLSILEAIQLGQNPRRGND